jgi:hypothetical protein
MRRTRGFRHGGSARTSRDGATTPFAPGNRADDGNDAGTGTGVHVVHERAHPFVEIMTLHRVGSGNDCERLQFYPTGGSAATDRTGSVIQL